MIASPPIPQPAGDAAIALMLVGPVEELIRHHRLVLAIGHFPISPTPATSASAKGFGLLIGDSRVGVPAYETRPAGIEDSWPRILGIRSFVVDTYLQSLLPIAKTGLDELVARGGLTIEIGGKSYQSSGCYVHVDLNGERLTITAYPQVPPVRGRSN